MKISWSIGVRAGQMKSRMQVRRSRQNLDSGVGDQWLAGDRQAEAKSHCARPHGGAPRVTQSFTASGTCTLALMTLQ